MKEDKNQEREHEKDPNVLPATEIVKNPNPRANENITEGDKSPGVEKHSPGTEITDGEDG